MHAAPIAPYPRLRGVIVPELLARAGCPVNVGDDSAETRARAAEGTIRWVKARMRRLPPEVLDAELPDPGFVLRSWTLAARTRGALARLGDPNAPRAWQVRDLLGAARLGPATLVDLLAAREEHTSRASAPVEPRPVPAPTEGQVPCRGSESRPLPSRLDALAEAITRRLPMRACEVPELLVSAGFTSEHLDAESLGRVFRDWQVAIPFRVIRRGGANLLVAPTALASVEALVSAASQAIFHWGLSSVSTIAERLRSLAAPELGAGVVSRVLSAVPTFRWLDEASGWFSFAGATSRVTLAIRKIFAVAERVPFAELAEALGKRVRVLSAAPRAVVEAYLSDVADCEMRDGWVRPRASFVPAPLAGGEQLIIDVFRTAGGCLARAELRRQALAAGVKVTTLRDFLRTSPLIVTTARGLRLVGVASRAPHRSAGEVHARAGSSAAADVFHIGIAGSSNLKVVPSPRRLSTEM
jgi:hypothetical protein